MQVHNLLQKRLWVFIIPCLFKRLSISNITFKKECTEKWWSGQSTEEASSKGQRVLWNPGVLRSGMMLWAGKKSAEWRFCPVTFVAMKYKPGTEPYSTSWSNPDMHAPQACILYTLGRGWCAESFTRELKDLLSHLKKTSMGKCYSANMGKKQKERLGNGYATMFPHVEGGTVISVAHTLPGMLQYSKRLYS